MALELATQPTAPGERGCPLTCGGPIKMTRDGFARCCAAKLEAAKEYDDFDREKKQNSRVQISFKNPCLVCQGPPALLTFIEVPDLHLIGGHHLTDHLAPQSKKKLKPKYDKAKRAYAMHNNWNKSIKSSKETESIEVPTNNGGGDMAGTKRCIGECSVCGLKKNVAKRQEGNICPTCENMRTFVKKRPEVTMAMLRKMAPELMSGGALSPVAPGKEEDLKESVALANAEADRDDLKRQVAELQAELSSARKAAQVVQADKAPRFEVVDTTAVPKLKDLALRIAFGLLDGNGVDVSVKDVELLMAV